MKRFNAYFYIFISIAFLAFLAIAGAGFYYFGMNGWIGGREARGRDAVAKQEAKNSAEGKNEKPLPAASASGVLPSSLPPYNGEPITKLNPSSASAASVGTAFLEKYQKNLADIAGRVANNTGTSDDWLAVAYIKKLFDNYTGARDALEYAKIVNPENPIAYFNLGELYGYELYDLGRAEQNYASAVRLNPYHLDYYVGLSNFYEDVMKNPEKAEKTLLAALGKIPQTEPNLFAAIGVFYRGQKAYGKAIEYFEKALGVAVDPAAKKAIQDEIDYIRSR